MTENGIKKFNVDISGLSDKEKQLVDKLILAAEMIAPLYLKQKNNNFPGANFYPQDATAVEIEEAGKSNPAILDPYTFVEREQGGSLIAVPFYAKFKEELKPISNLILEAAGLSEDVEFSGYLKSRAQALADGSYEKSDTVWLQSKPFKIGFIIGPTERYLDKLFFKKCAYQAWVGILNEEETIKAQQLKDLILSSRNKILPGSEKVYVLKLDVRVEKTIIFSGLIADFMFTGTNLPNDVNLMEEHGSNLTIFETSLEEKFRQDQHPIFKSIFSQEIIRNYSEKELYLASLRCIILHEISHSLIRYRDAEERLEDLFPVFDELNAYILGIKGCGILFLKGAMTQKDVEGILIMHICRNFTWWMDSLKNPDVKHYATGAAIAQNFFLEDGAIMENHGLDLPDFANLIAGVEKLSSLLGYYLALGNYEDAVNFVAEYKSEEVFKKQAAKLSSLMANR
jgi:hypothetical protein